MADREQLRILKQGVEAWNKWRSENRGMEIDLHKASLNKALLGGANLAGANLTSASLEKADLNKADLSDAHLEMARLSGAGLSKVNLQRAGLGQTALLSADLSEADLRSADLSEADLGGANLSKADLRRAALGGANLAGAVLEWVDLRRAILISASLYGADLRGADLTGAWLDGADLRRANLVGADLFGASLKHTDLRHARMGWTILPGNDLSEAVGLEAVDHVCQSFPGLHEMRRSRGKVPAAFLRGCGLSDWEVEAAKLYDPDLGPGELEGILARVHELRKSGSIQVSSLFLSYSHADARLVAKMEECLSERGLRFWRDVHDPDDIPARQHEDRPLDLNPTVLLILSKNSVRSSWVQDELRQARESQNYDVRYRLCPIALDQRWKTAPWSEETMQEITDYNIRNFSGWMDDPGFKRMFGEFLDSLELRYQR